MGPVMDDDGLLDTNETVFMPVEFEVERPPVLSLTGAVVWQADRCPRSRPGPTSGRSRHGQPGHSPARSRLPIGSRD